MKAWHWRASIRHAPRYVNIPHWPHRILVIGWGRLDSRGTFHDRQPCAYRMTLQRCCPGRTGTPSDQIRWGWDYIKRTYGG